MYKEYEIFTLKRPLPDPTVLVGTRGVVLMVFDGSPQAYEVEFPDGSGGNLGSTPTFTITEDFMAPIL